MNPQTVWEKFGDLVKITINKNAYPDTTSTNKNHYTLRYHPDLGPNSEIWIESFPAAYYYQIIDTSVDITLLQKDRKIPEPSCGIFTTDILLRSEGVLYGPFDCDIREGEMTLSGTSHHNFLVGKHEEIGSNCPLLRICDHNDNESVILIPRSSLSLPGDCEVRYDWITDERLLTSFFDSVTGKNSYPREKIRQFKRMATELLKGDSYPDFSAERVERVKSLVVDFCENDDYVETLIRYALEDENTRDRLIRELADKHFDQIRDKLEDHEIVRKDIEQLKSEEDELQKKLEELRGSLTSETSQRDQRTDEVNRDYRELQTANEKLQTANGELQSANEALRRQVQDFEKKNQLLREISELEGEREKLKKERERVHAVYEQQIKDNKALEEQFDKTLKSFNNRVKQTARVIDSKLLEKILRGIGDETEIKDIPPFDENLLHGHMDCNEIVEQVRSFICEKARRDIQKNDVVNYMICLTQGFITTFAGEPGTGKTSLCNILAKSLGLLAPSSKRFVDISVERGWSSQKDFIGYYNPLTKTMEKSNVEVFDAFAQLHSECETDPSRIAPFIILLDEANLSPIEHYWAAFLRNCDFMSATNRSIALGGNRSFKLPEHLRFLATVNFDHTTEELSPRFLDRSWVIMLQPSEIDEGLNEDCENSDDMVSFGSVKEAFSAGENDTIDDIIQTKWVAIKSVFNENKLQIMPRNRKMVKNYCAVACRCMERDKPTSKLAPLDYAFSQKILPTINGTGENYRKLIEDLLKECTQQNMPISAGHLLRMKTVADDNMGFFQFFSR